MLHFAFGSNMHRAIMRKHAPEAKALGAATLHDRRFIITSDGYASVEPQKRDVVHGMLWRLTPRDRVTLDLWENVARGLYRAETLPVHRGGRITPALVYVARATPIGAPRPGYMECVIEAARALEFPSDYITRLEQWLPKGRASSHPRFGDFG